LRGRKQKKKKAGKKGSAVPRVCMRAGFFRTRVGGVRKRKKSGL